jgi:hypothetical protein
MYGLLPIVSLPGRDPQVGPEVLEDTAISRDRTIACSARVVCAAPQIQSIARTRTHTNRKSLR